MSDLNTALSLAQQYKNYFRAFERAEEFLRGLAAAQNEADAIFRRRDDLTAELEEDIGALQARREELDGIVVLAAEHAAEVERKSDERIQVARASAEAAERDARVRTKSSVDKYEADAKRVINTLSGEITELRAARDEEQRRYNEAKKQREELLRRLGG